MEGIQEDRAERCTVSEDRVWRLPALDDFGGGKCAWNCVETRRCNRNE